MTNSRSSWQSLAVPLFGVLVFFMGCERSAPRKVPVAQGQPAANVPTPEGPFSKYEFRVEDGDIAVTIPSGELLRTATGCTVRLGSDDFDGSGVIIHRENNKIYVLTVAHAAAEGIDRVEVFSLGSYPKPSATFSDSDIEVLSTNVRADLALIRVTVDAEIEIEIASLAKPTPEKMGFSVGCGHGQPPKVLQEQITAADYFTIKLPGGNAKRFMWETKTGQKQGRSGGPLLDVNGCLLGIALGKVGGNGYYSHLGEISEFLVDNDLAALVTYAELLSTPKGK